MSRPLRSVRVPMLALSLLFALLASGCGLLGGSGSAIPSPGPAVGTALDAALPARIARLPLVDSTGRVRHLGDFAGKVVVLSDSMTLCQETCPIDTASLVAAARRIDADGAAADVEFLTVTVDPRRDSVAQMAAYRKQYGGPSNWLALTGTPAHINALWKYLGVYHKVVPSSGVHNWRTGALLTYDVQHSDETFFLDGSSHERFILEGMPHAPKASDIPKRIYRFLSANGRKNAKAAGDWTVPQAIGVTSWLLGRSLAS